MNYIQGSALTGARAAVPMGARPARRRRPSRPVRPLRPEQPRRLRRGRGGGGVAAEVRAAAAD